MTQPPTDAAREAVTQADKDAVTAFHSGQVARILAGDRTLGENRDAIEQAFARHRLAERERCAELADRVANAIFDLVCEQSTVTDARAAAHMAAESIAAAIRETNDAS